ncbi:unnamed protein product, partial [Staurois parvus]
SADKTAPAPWGQAAHAQFIFTKITAFPCCVYLNAGSGESGYSECRVRGERI